MKERIESGEREEFRGGYKEEEEMEGNGLVTAAYVLAFLSALSLSLVSFFSSNVVYKFKLLVN